MNVVWRNTRDLLRVVRLHNLWNPGFYCTLGQYSHLRASDLAKPAYRCWVTEGDNRAEGYAVLASRDKEIVFEEIWASCTGTPSPSLRLPTLDLGLLSATHSLVRRVSRQAKKALVRVASENTFGTLLATQFRWPLETSLLLSTGPPRTIPCPKLKAGLSVRPYEHGDEVAYSRIHNDSFGECTTPASYLSWVTKRSCKAFTATSKGEPVGLIIAELRRGGQIGDFNLVVKEEYRRNHVGTALLNEGIRVFQRLRVPKIVVDHWASNGAAVGFYKRFGLKLERSYQLFRVR
jgi:ribosomal protein S18 acetylase RimI-like enzyme